MSLRSRALWEVQSGHGTAMADNIKVMLGFQKKKKSLKNGWVYVLECNCRNSVIHQYKTLSLYCQEPGQGSMVWSYVSSLLLKSNGRGTLKAWSKGYVRRLGRYKNIHACACVSVFCSCSLFKLGRGIIVPEQKCFYLCHWQGKDCISQVELKKSPFNRFVMLPCWKLSFFFLSFVLQKPNTHQNMKDELKK